ncbi:MAG: GNAT family N-acetyltransferase [Carboxylicivirga sp.]|jgi:GNAT superfamily N-acetyltransferase|nr:GNAT family N-acetyltransferase [Carboxylicivirga sp.]
MNPTIRQATLADQSEVLVLLNSVFSENQRTASARDEAYWNWKFMDSPYGQSMVLVAEMDGRIIGVNNWWTWQLTSRGNIIKAYQPCDSAVHKDYRGKGCFRLLRLHGLKMAQEQGVQLLFNYPNKNSLHAYLSLGWHYQQTIPWMVKVLRPLMVVRALFTNDQTSTIKLDEQYNIDSELIREAEMNTSDYDHFIKINRVEGFYGWRYKNHPQRDYYMLTVKKGRKSCVAIFTVNQKGAHRELVVVDIIGAQALLPDLMKKVIQFGHKMRVNFVALMNNPYYQTEALWRMGFMRRNFKNMVVLPLDWSLEPLVKGYSNWSLMAALHDSI